MAIQGIWNGHNRTDRPTNETNERSHRWTHTHIQTNPNERWKAATIDTLSQRMPKRKKALHSVFFSFCCFFHSESNRIETMRIEFIERCIAFTIRSVFVALSRDWWDASFRWLFNLTKKNDLIRKCCISYVHICVHGTNDGKLKRSRTFEEKERRTESVHNFADLV